MLQIRGLGGWGGGRRQPLLGTDKGAPLDVYTYDSLNGWFWRSLAGAWVTDFCGGVASLVDSLKKRVNLMALWWFRAGRGVLVTRCSRSLELVALEIGVVVKPGPCGWMGFDLFGSFKWTAGNR